MNTAKSGHKFLIDIYGYLIKSCLLFGIIKLIVPVPRGLCLDRDLCCEIVPSLSWLSLRHYLHIISPYQDIAPREHALLVYISVIYIIMISSVT